MFNTYLADIFCDMRGGSQPSNGTPCRCMWESYIPCNMV